MLRELVSLFAVSAFAVGCATVRPEDHSAAEHEALATQEDKQAAALSERCKQGAPPGDVCWSSTTHPTAAQLKRTEQHRRMAAEHRAAAQSLRSAEAQACIGVPDRDRDQSPFDHREDIVSVEELFDRTLSGKNPVTRPAGATITFRAVPGMTAEWLQRVIDCHLARNAAMGWDMPEMTYCPLTVKGAKATVTSTGIGFAVTVRADEFEAVAEIIRRAKALQR